MQAGSQTKLSVSVVCYNSPSDQLRLLVDSLLTSIQYMRQHLSVSVVPVFLVDNSDRSPSSLEIFDDKQSTLDLLGVELQYFGGHGNIGYGRAHNMVLPKIESDFHLILNPDVILEKETLSNAINTMSNNSNVKVLSPRARDPKGNTQYLCKCYPSVLTLFIRGFFPKYLKRFFSKRLDAYEMREIADAEVSEGILLVSGCFMLTETDALKAVEGFDESYFLYFEDYDLSLRIGKLGRLAYASNVRITHCGGNSSSKGLWHIRAFIISGIRFFNKHGWRFF